MNYNIKTPELIVKIALRHKQYKYFTSNIIFSFIFYLIYVSIFLDIGNYILSTLLVQEGFERLISMSALGYNVVKLSSMIDDSEYIPDYGRGAFGVCPETIFCLQKRNKF